MTGDFRVPTPVNRGTYTISFRTPGGQLNPSPVTYDIDSIADRPPTARFVQPDKPAIKVPANVKVDLVATGSDDFGVRTANLVVMNGERTVINKDLFEDQDPKPEFKIAETIDLEKLGLKPGDALRYKLSIADNKHPSPNKMETALQLIEVIEPVSPPEKKKFEEAQKDQQREQANTGQEEQSQEQPDKAGTGDAEQQPSDPNAKERAGKESGEAGKSNEKNDQGADSGNANQDAGGEKEEGAGDNKNQLTPEKEKALENLLKNAKSKQLGSKKDGNPPEGQPKADEEKTNAGKQDSTTTPGKNDQTENEANPKSRDAKKPGKLEQTGRTNPDGAPPADNKGAENDQTDQVKRAEQSDRAQASEEEKKANQKNTEKGNRKGADGSRTGEAGESPKSEGAENSGDRAPGEQKPKDMPRNAKDNEKTAPSEKRKDQSDASRTSKTEKNGADQSEPNGKKDSSETPNAKDEPGAQQKSREREEKRRTQGQGRIQGQE